jgi:hypothetical protein
MNAFNAPRLGRTSNAVICRNFLGFVKDSSRSREMIFVLVLWSVSFLSVAVRLRQSRPCWQRGFSRTFSRSSPESSDQPRLNSCRRKFPSPARVTAASRRAAWERL